MEKEQAEINNLKIFVGLIELNQYQQKRITEFILS